MKLSLLGLLMTTTAFAESEAPYTAKSNQFPPLEHAYYLAGELIQIDHVNRTGILRPDRTDKQPKKFQDLPHKFSLLPYCSLRYHGAPAALSDIPIGTHLHGYFYLGPEGDIEAVLPRWPQQPLTGYEIKYNQVLSLEDDFSFYSRQGRIWKINSIDLEKDKLNVSQVGKSKNGLQGDQSFDIDPSTRVWNARQIGTLRDLTIGQQIQSNLTMATIFGPGRCTEIWLDEESRKTAAEHQRQRHIQHMKYRGLPALVEAVKHEGAATGTVSAVLFSGSDASLYAEFKPKESLLVLVVEPSLRTYDQANLGRGSRVLEVKRNENSPPGSSGIQVTFRTHKLAEGFRPGRIIRIFPGSKVKALPREERLRPEDVMPSAQREGELRPYGSK